MHFFGRILNVGLEADDEADHAYLLALNSNCLVRGQRSRNVHAHPTYLPYPYTPQYTTHLRTRTTNQD